jgi:hypothetical protein
MAWDDDRDRVTPVGGTDCTRRFRISDDPREIGVAPRFAKRNPKKLGPYAPLKRRAAEIKGKVEALQRACEICAQLVRRFAQDWIVGSIDPFTAAKLSREFAGGHSQRQEGQSTISYG